MMEVLALLRWFILVLSVTMSIFWYGVAIFGDLSPIASSMGTIFIILAALTMEAIRK